MPFPPSSPSASQQIHVQRWSKHRARTSLVHNFFGKQKIRGANLWTYANDKALRRHHSQRSDQVPGPSQDVARPAETKCNKDHSYQSSQAACWRWKNVENGFLLPFAISNSHGHDFTCAPNCLWKQSLKSPTSAACRCSKLFHIFHLLGQLLPARGRHGMPKIKLRNPQDAEPS